MMSNQTDWIDNPYRTIYEFLYLRVVRGSTVRETLRELEEGMNKSGNEVGKHRVSTITEHFNEIVSDGILDNEEEFTQQVILMKLELIIKTKLK